MVSNLSTVDNGTVVCFDVDGTIIRHEHDGEDEVQIVGNLGITDMFQVNKSIAQRIKHHAMQGHYVIVWSQAGHQWAQDVLYQLNLTQYVNLIITKPKWMYDDVSPEKWATVFDPEAL